MTEEIKHIRTDFLNQIKSIIAEARQQALRAVDSQRVLMYWNIGKTIFEEEQQGKERAEYGTYLIKGLSKELEPECGTSFSVRQLSWTQYRLLIRIEDESKREYYLAEAAKNNWTAPQLEQQINSQLYNQRTGHSRFLKNCFTEGKKYGIIK